jgi:hypothetical protein
MMKRMLLSGLSFLVLAGCTAGPQAKYPVDGLSGGYTVCAYYYWDVVEKDGSVTTYAVAQANAMAEKLRQGGQQAYVADLGTEAAVVVGSYPSWDAAKNAALGLAKVLQTTVGLPQITVVKPRVGSGTQQLSVEPFAMDLKVLKERSRRLRHLHP